jgi:flagellar hook protein FlgE
MLRALFSGISGLRTHSQMLDVTSNNIANVNTIGFKSVQTTFEDALSQTLTSASAATANTGGTTAIQIGLGVRLASTNTNLSQGSNQITNRNKDVLINGDGFFAVQQDGAQRYTRAGSFNLDIRGHLVTPDGALVEDSTGAPLDLSALQSGTYTSWSISTAGQVVAIDSSGATTVLGTIGVAMFPNADGLARAGNTTFIATTDSGAATVGAPGAGGRGSLTPGQLETSNVDLSQELTNLIIAERGFQANSRVITTSDEVLQTLVNLKN